MKYAMIPINFKRDDEGTHVRRVLVSYLFKVNKKYVVTYYGTKFITADDYFYSDKATHKYSFKNRYYRLLDANSLDYDSILFKKKRYHFKKYSFLYTDDVEFKSKSVTDAINKFKNRNELK